MPFSFARAGREQDDLDKEGRFVYLTEDVMREGDEKIDTLS